MHRFLLLSSPSHVSFRLPTHAQGELEGNNVSAIMPPPFSQQHDGYLHT